MNELMPYELILFLFLLVLMQAEGDFANDSLVDLLLAEALVDPR